VAKVELNSWSRAIRNRAPGKSWPLPPYLPFINNGLLA
jgi:hypothetical protein